MDLPLGRAAKAKLAAMRRRDETHGVFDLLPAIGYRALDLLDHVFVIELWHHVCEAHLALMHDSQHHCACGWWGGGEVGMVARQCRRRWVKEMGKEEVSRMWVGCG